MRSGGPGLLGCRELSAAWLRCAARFCSIGFARSVQSMCPNAQVGPIGRFFASISVVFSHGRSKLRFLGCRLDRSCEMVARRRRPACCAACCAAALAVHSFQSACPATQIGKNDQEMGSFEAGMVVILSSLRYRGCMLEGLGGCVGGRGRGRSREAAGRTVPRAKANECDTPMQEIDFMKMGRWSGLKPPFGRHVLQLVT